MRIQFYWVFSLCLLMQTTQVFAQENNHNGPEVYGKVNVEYLQIEQDEKFKTTSGAGVFNVRGSETRAGIKGNYELDQSKVNYQVELGLDSTRINPEGDPYGMSGRIRIRLAYAQLESQFGKLTMGQDFTPSARVLNNYDPLGNTSLGLTGLSQAELIKGSKRSGTSGDVKIEDSLGMYYRTRRDQLKYQTPSFYGLSLTTSVDRNDNSDISHQKGGDTHYENLISYNKTFSSFDLKLHLAHITWSNVETSGENVWMAGTQINHLTGLSTSLLYTSEKYKSNVSNQTANTDVKRMMATISYQRNNSKWALTYAKRDTENSARSEMNFDKIEPEDMFSTEQIALGYKYFIDENVELKLTLGHLRHTEDDDDLAKINDNKTTLAAAGIEVTF